MHIAASAYCPHVRFPVYVCTRFTVTSLSLHPVEINLKNIRDVVQIKTQPVILMTSI